MARHALLAWADDALKPAAELAYAGNGKAACGSWCGFCKAKATCRARAKANLELAKHEFRVPPLIEDTDVEEILGKLYHLVAWASDIKDHALKQAPSGKRWLASSSSKDTPTGPTSMRKPWPKTVCVTGRPAAMSIAGQMTQWKRVMSPPYRGCSASPLRRAARLLGGKATGQADARPSRRQTPAYGRCKDRFQRQGRR